MISMVVFIYPIDTIVYTEIISPIWRDSGEIKCSILHFVFDFKQNLLYCHKIMPYNALYQYIKNKGAVEYTLLSFQPARLDDTTKIEKIFELPNKNWGIFRLPNLFFLLPTECFEHFGSYQRFAIHKVVWFVQIVKEPI